jgi:hypothetical protein
VRQKSKNSSTSTGAIDKMSDSAKAKVSVFQLTVEELEAIVQQAVLQAIKSAPKPDELLTVEQVCEILKCEPEWLYHNAKKLLFTRKVGGLLRFSSNGLQRYIASKRLKAAKDGEDWQ